MKICGSQYSLIITVFFLSTDVSRNVKPLNIHFPIHSPSLIIKYYFRKFTLFELCLGIESRLPLPKFFKEVTSNLYKFIAFSLPCSNWHNIKIEKKLNVKIVCLRTCTNIFSFSWFSVYMFFSSVEEGTGLSSGKRLSSLDECREKNKILKEIKVWDRGVEDIGNLYQ